MTEFHSLPSMLCNRPVLYSMSIIIFMFIPVFFNRGSVEPLCSAKHVVGFLEDSLFYLRGNDFLLQHVEFRLQVG